MILESIIKFYLHVIEQNYKCLNISLPSSVVQYKYYYQQFYPRYSSTYIGYYSIAKNVFAQTRFCEIRSIDIFVCLYTRQTSSDNDEICSFY